MFSPFDCVLFAIRSSLLLKTRRIVTPIMKQTAPLEFGATLWHPEPVIESWQRRKGIGFALLAAVLFGLSTPLAKSVSPLVQPTLLAGLLYLGSGIGLGVYSLFQLAQ